MSHHTQELEAEACRALLAAIQAPQDALGAGADNAVWKITASVIAKVQENLLSETTQVRNVACARAGETTVAAVRRMASERNGIAKKYQNAKAAWEDERAKFAVVLDAAREATCDTHGIPACVELGNALRAYDLARGAVCATCDGAGTIDGEEDDPGEGPPCSDCDGTGLVEP